MTTPPLRPGLRLRSRTCPAEVIVIRVGAGHGSLECGGLPMASSDDDDLRSSVSGGAALTSDGVLLGKRYADETQALEVLCTKAGAGPLTVDGAVLKIKPAKPLPASD